jgi:hypothetical protein
MRKRCLGEEHITENVGAKRALDLLDRKISEVLDARLNGRIAHHDIETPELFDGFVDSALAEPRIADVPFQQFATLPFVFDGAPRLLCVGVVAEISNGDVRSFARIEYGDRATDARVAAGDERDFALELRGRTITGRVVPRSRLELCLFARTFQLLLRIRRLGARIRTPRGSFVGFA